ncbi:MAG TPA: sigma-70 family RNA polymerase sigma factor [Candidatus Ozemobacteraceae bacterium]|nr:sigma-70 family RNA polymerase sigma factor [Candidatus Ozemobacteraceae bacterium]
MTEDVRSDAELVRLILQGESQRFQSLVERYERLMYSYLLPQVHHWQEVEDIAQEAFLKAFRHLNSFDTARKFSAWLLKIARNILIDRYRKNAQNRREAEAYATFLQRFARTSETNTAQVVEKDDEFRRLFLDVFDLPEEFRVPLLLRIVEELSYEEIADIIDAPLQTVKNRIFKARRQLREKWERSDGL